MKDAKLKFYDNADISTSPVSDIIKVPDASDSDLTGALHGFANNVSGAIYMNVVVNAAITGAEVVTLEDSADGSSWAATAAVITVGAAAAGTVLSVAIPTSVRNYLRAAETVGTVGTISVFLGQKEQAAA